MTLRSLLLAASLLAGSLVALGQETSAGFEGMWSDPPVTATGWFCFAFCTQAGIDRLNALLDDPANDDREYAELSTEAAAYQQEEYFRPRLTPAALATFPIDPADDPGFLRCEPWGFARQIFAPHQIDIRQFDDRIELHYGEWDAHRTVFLDGREPPANEPPSLMGFSVGHYEGDALVIETTNISANITLWWTHHSDQLRVTERYTRSEDGQLLYLDAVFEDPWGTTQPLELQKLWTWAPDQQIFAYESCEPPTEFSRGTTPE